MRRLGRRRPPGVLMAGGGQEAPREQELPRGQEAAGGSEAVLEVAGRLMRRAGLPPPRCVSRLSGGRNNRVFRVDGDYVLKLYHWDPRDPRDRLRAEWRFLCHAWSRGVTNIPRPLARDEAAHAGLYTLLPGAVPAAGAVGPEHVEAALDFVLAVNAGRRAPDALDARPHEPEALDAASEACFSLREHIATIDRRVGQLGLLDPALEERAAVEALIATRLRPAWQVVRSGLLDAARRIGLDPDEAIAGPDRCVSPSDFGFHNALVADGRVGFIDFEYAGRDDPAKLVCDFFCQPQVPVPLGCMAGFTRRLIGGLGMDARHEARCRLLLDAYRVKWACIMLNDFLPLGSARRSHAEVARTEARRGAQLARAAAKLDEIDAT